MFADDTYITTAHEEIGIGRTWEKFSSSPAKKPRKFETATGKENV